MESYITSELPQSLFSSFSELDSSRVSISGHSMGGHGALTLFLKNPGMYKSVSAFAPIANPTKCPWGEKAFTGYFGDEDKEGWKKHDATELVKGWEGERLDILIDVGTGDNFYKQGQLLPENFEKAVQESGKKGLVLRYQDVSTSSRLTILFSPKVSANNLCQFRDMIIRTSLFPLLRRIISIMLLNTSLRR